MQAAARRHNKDRSAPDETPASPLQRREPQDAAPPESRVSRRKPRFLDEDTCSRRNGSLASVEAGGAKRGHAQVMNDMSFPAPGLSPHDGVGAGKMYAIRDFGSIARRAVRANVSLADAGYEPFQLKKRRLSNAVASRSGFATAAAVRPRGAPHPVFSSHPEAYAPDRQSKHGGTSNFPRPRRAAATQASPEKVQSPNGQQDAHRRITPGRDPGGGAAR